MDQHQNETKILNALRMGVIPNANLEELLVGKEAEKGEIANFLNTISKEKCSIVKFIKGEYGTGKTFLLNYMKQMALDKNFVVATVPINSGFNFSKFDIFYTNIMSSLSIGGTSNEGGTSFEEIFNIWIKELKNLGSMSLATQDIYKLISQLSSYNSSFSSVLLTYIRAKIRNDYDLANIAASWIKGDRNVSYQLKKQLKIKGSVDKENALDIFTGFIKLLTLIGYSGIIIQIDEAELIMNERSDIRAKAYANIRHMIDLCGIGDLENCGVIFAGTNELFENEEKGFKSYGALYQRMGENISSGKISNVRQPIIQLSDFKEEDFYKLSEKILNIHENYYGYRSVTDINSIYNLVMVECMKSNQKDKVTVRKYLKKLLEILDLMQENPNLPIFNSKVQAIRR